MTVPSRPAAASVHESQGKRGALPPAIRPLRPSMRVWGPAFPVRVPPGNNLLAHWAVYAAAAGEVLVIDAGAAEHGHWGEILSFAAAQRGLGGLVIDGGVRDTELLAAGDFPVFASSVSIRGTGKDQDPGATLGEPITLGGVTVGRGDLVVGDADGVVVVAAAEAAEVTARAVRREQDERQILARLAAGATTMDVYGLPDPSTAATGRSR